jgi:hypothetical protein
LVYLVQLEASYDNNVFFPIAVISGNYPDYYGNFTAVRQALGAYNFLRVNLAQIDSTNCQATVWYSGNLYGSSSGLNAVPGINTGYVPNNFSNAQATASTVAVTMLQIPSVNVRTSIYGVTLQNQCANPTTVNINDCGLQSSGNCTGGGGIGVTTHTLFDPGTNFIVPANGTFSLPNSTVPYFIARPGGNLYLQMTTTTTNCAIEANYVYRYE